MGTPSFALFLSLLLAVSAPAQPSRLGSPTNLPDPCATNRIVRDGNDIAHISAGSEYDLFFLQGCVHAQDRLFQMDVARRTASGTLAELVGPSALAQDVELRPMGLRRAAERSLLRISPRAYAVLQAYADGVNTFVAANSLPPEYAALELSKFTPWTPADSLAVLKLTAFELSFQLDIDPTITLQSYQAVLGPDNGSELFFDDVWRSAPFDSATTISDPTASLCASRARKSFARHAADSSNYLHPQTFELAKQYLERTKNIPLFQRLRDRRRRGGSNEWAISGAYAENGVPLLANDPHLSLVTPSTFYPVHLRAREGNLDVAGNSYPGVPTVALGHNKFISWGATVDTADVTDTYQEQIVSDSSSPSGLSTIYQGRQEPIIPIPEVFRENNMGDVTVVPPGTVLATGVTVPQFTLIVPRRNDGPLISFNMAAGIGLSVQWTGFSGTREIEAGLIWAKAKDLDDFLYGLRFASSGSLNFAYSDTHGNIAYIASGEVPIREDLQAGTVSGLPPFFIRNGTGGNEWLPVIHPQPDQSIPYEILPFAEMPHIVNPKAGWFVNANNDPSGITLQNDPLSQQRPGGGIYYLAYTFDPGFRAGRITQMIEQQLSNKARLSATDMEDMQADVVLHDAQVFVPYIEQAFSDAIKAGANGNLATLAAAGGVGGAVSRLSNWDFTTPTGIPEGYDARGKYGPLVTNLNSDPTDAAVAATLYSVWRGEFIANTIDWTLANKLGLGGLPTVDGGESLKALRSFLDNSTTVGASGVDFFLNVSGVTSPTDRRDYVILQSLKNALDLLAGPAFVDAFAGSSNQSDYLWGKLHRVIFAHPLGPPFSIPPADGGTLLQLGDNLPGISTDGGYETVDDAAHDVRAASENGFMFTEGPNDRFVSEATSPHAMHAVSSLPGGVSGVLGSPFYFNLLEDWLLNKTFPLP